METKQIKINAPLKKGTEKKTHVRGSKYNAFSGLGTVTPWQLKDE